MKRRDGWRSKIKLELLEDIHVVAYILDPSLSDKVEDAHMELFHSNAVVYAAGLELKY